MPIDGSLHLEHRSLHFPGFCFDAVWQVLVVYGQTQGLKKSKWATMLFEMLSVFTFVKPGVDAYRVASGAEQAPGAAFTPLMEMLFTKADELAFEAIPG